MAAAPPRKQSVLAPFPRVYPILDRAHLEARGRSAARIAEDLACAGIRIAQYRHKGSFTRAAYEEASRVAAVFRAAGVCFILNDRADIALALRAHGVHVGQDDLPLADVRRLVGDGLVVGYSTHNAAQIAADECRWADYLAVGPVFGTRSKERPEPAVGLEGVRLARSLTSKPLVAIGGITVANAARVLAAGADGVSMISGLDPHNLRDWAALDA